MDKPVYLGSKSPRRKELLGLTGIKFNIFSITGMDEDALLAEYPGDILEAAEHLAVEKARLALSSKDDGIFITADTLVITDDGSVLGKPSGKDEARQFLNLLAGNWHTVVTGVALAESGSQDQAEIRIASTLETTRVKFAPMTSDEIEEYIATDEPYDKAGGYGIQGRASVHIEGIEGCYFNVVGFPLHAFWKLWKSFTCS